MENRERALELHEAGHGDKARTAFQKAIIVTHEMAHELMKVRGWMMTTMMLTRVLNLLHHTPFHIPGAPRRRRALPGGALRGGRAAGLPLDEGRGGRGHFGGLGHHPLRLPPGERSARALSVGWGGYATDRPTP